MKEIPFVLMLNPDGTPIGLNETYEGEGKARRAKLYLVPQTVKRAVNIAANLLWDNPEYVLGVTLKGRPKRVVKQHAAFKQRVEDLGLMTDPGLAAVRSFLSRPDKVKALQVFGSSWEELKKDERKSLVPARGPAGSDSRTAVSPSRRGDYSCGNSGRQEHLLGDR